MPRIHTQAFKGTFPRIRPHLLPDENAQTASNVNVEEGSVKSIKAVSQERALGTTTDWRSLFRVPSNSGSDFWFLSTSSSMKAILSPTSVVDATQKSRFYFTDGVRCAKSDWVLASNSGGTDEGTPIIYYFLGVPAASVALTVAKQNTDATEDLLYAGISYVYTFVTEWGEESIPNAASITQDVNETEHFHLSGFTEPHTFGGPYNLIGIRIYRVSSGNAGSEYQMVAGLNDSGKTYISFGTRTAGTGKISCTNGTSVAGVGTLFSSELSVDDYIYCNGQWAKIASIGGDLALVVDSSGFTIDLAGASFEYVNSPWMDVSDLQNDDGGSEILHQDQLSIVLASTLWNEPPAALRGITLLSNNCTAGFIDNKLYLSTPNFPFAMPSGYQSVTNTDITGIGAYETTVVVLTGKFPYIFECYDPLNVSKKVWKDSLPCLWESTIVSGDTFVIFASRKGVYRYSGGTMTRLTGPIYSRQQWKDLLTSSAAYDRQYVACLYDDKYFGFFIGESEGFYIDLETGDLRTFDLGKVGDYYINVYDAAVDSNAVTMFLLTKTNATYQVEEWEGAATNLAYTWKSKEYRSNVDVSYTYGRLTGSFSSGIALRVWQEGTLRLNTTIANESVFQFDCPAGKKLEYQISGSEEVYTVALASSPSELG